MDVETMDGVGRPSPLLFWAGAAMGAVGGLVAVRRFAARRAMPRLKLLQREWAKRRGKGDAARLAAEVQVRYEELVASRPRIANRALRSHFEDNILPGLAIYRALRELEPDTAQKAILDEMEELFAAYFARAAGRLRGLDRWAIPLPLFRRLARWTMRLSFPSEGWEVRWLEEKESCVAFDIHRCFYLDVLTAYGAPELTALYCRMDDLLFEQLAPDIQWERTRTLGRGDARCDFRWRWIGE